MSIKVMTMVWDGFPAAGSELLAMLALADWCDDRGGCLHPSIKAVADKVRVGEKHARNILHKFVDDGFLAVVGNLHGGKPGTTRSYRLNVAKLQELADASNATKKVAPDEWEGLFETAPLEVTPPPQGSPTPPLEVTRTAPLQVTEGSPAEEPIHHIDKEIPIQNTRDASLASVGKPESVSNEVWQDFKALRAKKKAPITATAMAGIQREAQRAGWELEAALRECCERGWQAFKADWVARRETAYAQAMREKYEVAAPAVAIRMPMARAIDPNTFFDQPTNLEALTHANNH